MVTRERRVSELNKPVLTSTGNYFAVTLENKSSFSAQQEQWLMMFQQFNISPLQKRILLVGMGDREVSPADIYKAIGKDRDTYDKEVTGLRHAGLLIEIRTSAAAKQFADSRHVLKNTIGRFRVQIPGVNVAIAGQLSPANQTSKPANQTSKPANQISKPKPAVKAKRPVFSGYTGGTLRALHAKTDKGRPRPGKTHGSTSQTTAPSRVPTRQTAIDLRLLTRQPQRPSTTEPPINPSQDHKDSKV